MSRPSSRRSSSSNIPQKGLLEALRDELLDALDCHVEPELPTTQHPMEPVRMSGLLQARRVSAPTYGRRASSPHSVERCGADIGEQATDQGPWGSEANSLVDHAKPSSCQSISSVASASGGLPKRQSSSILGSSHISTKPGQAASHASTAGASHAPLESTLRISASTGQVVLSAVEAIVSSEIQLSVPTRASEVVLVRGHTASVPDTRESSYIAESFVSTSTLSKGRAGQVISSEVSCEPHEYGSDDEPGRPAHYNSSNVVYCNPAFQSTSTYQPAQPQGPAGWHALATAALPQQAGRRSSTHSLDPSAAQPGVNTHRSASQHSLDPASVSQHSHKRSGSQRSSRSSSHHHISQPPPGSHKSSRSSSQFSLSSGPVVQSSRQHKRSSGGGSSSQYSLTSSQSQGVDVHSRLHTVDSSCQPGGLDSAHQASSSACFSSSHCSSDGYPAPHQQPGAAQSGQTSSHYTSSSSGGGSGSDGSSDESIAGSDQATSSQEATSQSQASFTEASQPHCFTHSHASDSETDEASSDRGSEAVSDAQPRPAVAVDGDTGAWGQQPHLLQEHQLVARDELLSRRLSLAARHRSVSEVNAQPEVPLPPLPLPAATQAATGAPEALAWHNLPQHHPVHAVAPGPLQHGMLMPGGHPILAHQGVGSGHSSRVSAGTDTNSSTSHHLLPLLMQPMDMLDQGCTPQIPHTFMHQTFSGGAQHSDQLLMPITAPAAQGQMLRQPRTLTQTPRAASPHAPHVSMPAPAHPSAAHTAGSPLSGTPLPDNSLAHHLATLLDSLNGSPAGLAISPRVSTQPVQGFTQVPYHPPDHWAGDRQVDHAPLHEAGEDADDASSAMARESLQLKALAYLVRHELQLQQPAPSPPPSPPAAHAASAASQGSPASDRGVRSGRVSDAQQVPPAGGASAGAAAAGGAGVDVDGITFQVHNTFKTCQQPGESLLSAFSAQNAFQGCAPGVGGTGAAAGARPQPSVSAPGGVSSDAAAQGPAAGQQQGLVKTHSACAPGGGPELCYPPGVLLEPDTPITPKSHRPAFTLDPGASAVRPSLEGMMQAVMAAGDATTPPPEDKPVVKPGTGPMQKLLGQLQSFQTPESAVTHGSMQPRLQTLVTPASTNLGGTVRNLLGRINTLEEEEAQAMSPSRLETAKSMTERLAQALHMPEPSLPPPGAPTAKQSVAAAVACVMSATDASSPAAAAAVVDRGPADSAGEEGVEEQRRNRAASDPTSGTATQPAAEEEAPRSRSAGDWAQPAAGAVLQTRSSALVSRPSRLAQTTFVHEPTPEQDSPPSLPSLEAASELAASAAALSAQPPAAGAGVVVVPSSLHAPSQPRRRSSDEQVAIEPPKQAEKEGLKVLLQKLSEAGYSVPPQAAMALSLYLDDPSGASKVVASQLHASGAPPRLAGWVPQVQGASAVQEASWRSSQSSVLTDSTDPQQGSVASSSLVSNRGQASAGPAGGSLNMPRPSAAQQQQDQQEADDAAAHAMWAAKEHTQAILAGKRSVGWPLEPVPEKRAVSYPLQQHQGVHMLPAALPYHPAQSQPANTSKPQVQETSVLESGRQAAGTSGQVQVQSRPGATQPRKSPRGVAPGGGVSPREAAEHLVISPEDSRSWPGDVHMLPETQAQDAGADDSKAEQQQEDRFPSPPSLLQAWRDTTHQARVKAEALQRVIQLAPSSPNKATQANQSSLRSESPLLTRHRSGSPAARQQQPGLEQRPGWQSCRQSPPRSMFYDAGHTELAVRARDMQVAVRSSWEQQLMSEQEPRGISYAPSGQRVTAAAANSPIMGKPVSAGAIRAQVSSILDMAGGGGGAGQDGRGPAGAGQPVDIQKAFAWQERETRVWLASMSLEVFPHEEEAGLLDNPLRNGVLLCDVASHVTGVPVRQAVVPPQSLAESRANTMLALDHMGLLGDFDDTTLAQLCAGELLISLRPSDVRAHQGSYSARLREKQAKLGISLVREVEKVLQGRRDACWTLLNFVRESCCRQQAFLGPSTHMASAHAAADRAAAAMQARTDTSSALQQLRVLPPASSPPGSLGPRPRWSKVVQGSSRLDSTYDREPLVKGGPAEDYGYTCILSSGVGPPTYVYGPRDMSPGRKMRLQAEQQQDAVLQKQLRLARRQQTLDDAAALTARAWGHEVECSADVRPASARQTQEPHQGGTRPSWTSPKLPYTPDEVEALEASILRWLLEINAIDYALVEKGFGALIDEMSDGTFLCWLTQRLVGQPIKGINKRPLVEAHRRSNITRVIQTLRATPGMSRRSLNYEEALLHAERPALTCLLEDLHRLAAGGPPAGSVWQQGCKPFLPYMAVVDEQDAAAIEEQRSVMTGGHLASSSLLTPPPSRGRSTRPVSAPRSRGGDSGLNPHTTTTYQPRPPASPSPGSSLQRRGTSPPSHERPRPWSPPGIATLFVTPARSATGRLSPTKQGRTQGSSSPRDTYSPRAGGDASGWRDDQEQLHRQERRAAAGLAGAPKVGTFSGRAAAKAALMGDALLASASHELDEYLHKQDQGQWPGAAADQEHLLTGHIPTLRLTRQTLAQTRFL